MPWCEVETALRSHAAVPVLPSAFSLILSSELASRSLQIFLCSKTKKKNFPFAATTSQMATPDAKVRALYGRLRDSVSDFTAEQV